MTSIRRRLKTKGKSSASRPTRSTRHRAKIQNMQEGRSNTTCIRPIQTSLHKHACTNWRCKIHRTPGRVMVSWQFSMHLTDVLGISLAIPMVSQPFSCRVCSLWPSWSPRKPSDSHRALPLRLASFFVHLHLLNKVRQLPPPLPPSTTFVRALFHPDGH